MKLLKLWPGLEYLARHGSFRAWLAAMFYAIFAMAVICVTLLWDSILPPFSQKLLLFLFTGTWILGLVVSSRFEKAFQEAQKQHQREAVAQDTLPLAQTEYLRQNFFEAERLLRERLTKFPEDVPARFFLISVLKKQKRKAEALEQIAILEKNPKLGFWGLDLPHEKKDLLNEEE
ncbi:MAG: hypothetical protein E7028_02985 [Planctomycetaceae bacterium]|nr:hypothetical protein [Planctomycetaceae bacterium]